MKITKKNLEKLIEQELQELDRNDQVSIDIKVGVDGVEAKREANIITVRYNGKVSSGRIQSYASTVNYEDLTNPNDSDKKNYDKAIQSALQNVGAPTKGVKENMKITIKNLQKIIKEEVDAVISEQAATIRLGMQQKSDLTGTERSIAFTQSLERLTKEELKTKIEDAESRVAKNESDAISQKMLDDIKAAFPLRLQDGDVQSYEDLMKPEVAGYTDPGGFTGIAPTPAI